MSKTKNLSKVLALVIMLALVIGVLPMAASATTAGWVSVASGEMIAIDWTDEGNNTYSGVVVDAYTLSSTTYTMPKTFTLWTHGTPTFTYDNTKIAITPIDTNGQDEAYKVDVTNIPANSTASLTVVIPSGTYSVDLPAKTAAAVEGTYPSYVNGYLPVGQFATGGFWGGIYTNNLNTNSTTTKFTGGFPQTGVSLGACGGYIQFEFDSPISNDADNPYGVDFVVYGNAFSGNAEAGSVQVSNDGTHWYELAGSRYYRPGTLRNVNISYKLVTDLDEVERVYYKIWDMTGPNHTEHIYKNWSYLFPASDPNDPAPNTKGWWPRYTQEHYGTVSGVDAVFKGHAMVSEAAWSDSNNMITYYHVTLVTDYDDAAAYTFGYADVHGNGSANGYASNPYAAGSNTTGGDGFDIRQATLLRSFHCNRI